MPDFTPFEQYQKQLSKELKAGNATEHTHRPALKTLVQSLIPGIIATNEPKRVACGAPDFIITKSETPLGYIETKDVGKSLDDIEKTDQLKRYFNLGNLVLTDYLEFRWYVLGKRRMVARLATAGPDGKLWPVENGEAAAEELLTSFLKADIPTVDNPKQLAERMARLARAIRPEVMDTILKEEENGSLRRLMEGFRKVLLHNLTEEEFADMYTQTLCYGLFAARCNHDPSKQFSRRTAPFDIPKTNPFLRDLFSHFAGLELEDQPYVWAVDDLASLLERTDMAAILEDFGKRTRREDPVVHFYETFLSEYNPAMREARGVYYTPEPVVSYIVRSVDHILKTDFGLPGGLADSSMVKIKTRDEEEKEVHKVQILDPATGTGTFLFQVIKQIHDSFEGNQGMWPAYVQKHLLPRLFGFELLMAPYAVAHLKLGLQLKETGYDFGSDERLKIYLTNTLEEAFKADDLTLWAQKVAEEANGAGEVKRDFPIMVVLGNPPYSGHSANKGEWIHNLLHGKDTMTGQATENYFEVDGKPLGEKNPKWLNDDYVKFIRFSQWRIEQTGYGILAFITNHGYLDNPTFRGMRQSLMETFDDIYILDLHGNSKKKETAPDGSKDENVFDIQQGVAICIMVKQTNKNSKSASVYHIDVYGSREAKYKSLANICIDNTKWNILHPSSPFYLFSEQDIMLRSEYESYYSITDALITTSVGIVTARDSLTIRWSDIDIWKLINDFIVLDKETARIKYELGCDARDWKVELAQEDVRKSGPSKNNVIPILYRPFDIRWTYFTGASRGFHCMPRGEVMRNFLKDRNIAIVAGRSGAVTGDTDWRVISVTKCVIDFNYYRRGGGQVFPLYLYPSEHKTSLFDEDIETDTPGGRKPNLAPEFIADIEKKTGMSFVKDGKGGLKETFGPEDVFDYIYAVFHSPTYRTRYAEFLKIDFPRVPLTSNPELFRSLCKLGEELVAFHLMEKQGPDMPNYPVDLPMSDEMKDKVGDVRYTAPGQGAESGRVWINKKQYFENVPPEVWEFHIGGYQVCQKWLKDRKGRVLTYDDLQHYRSIAAALAETIRIMSEIDEIIDQSGGWPIA
ncbi:MAG: type ISP restriction/modification enzyme [Armatimonadota bacterium]